jgi:hypothetical protein
VHHDVDVGEDGTIYCITHENVNERPRGLESIPPPWLVDSLAILSPEGKELKKPISVLDAFCNSPYAPLLSRLQPRLKRDQPPSLTNQTLESLRRDQDVLHVNSVVALSEKLAPKFPLFKAGQLLLSIRNLDLIAVLDPDLGSLVWAATGPWRAQHDAQFLDNGNILIFDNLGSPSGSRVLEYDPVRQGFPWSYPGDVGAPFFTSERGMSQRLPNGNTLVVNSEAGEMLEVTSADEVVWNFALKGYIPTGRRYAASQLPFLNLAPRSRH